MTNIENVNLQRFTLNGIQYFKNFVSKVAGNYITIYNAYDSKDVLLENELFSNIAINGNTYSNPALVQSNLLPNIFNRDTLGSGSISDLEYVSSASNGQILNTAGTDAIIPLATTLLAGLLSPNEKTKLNNTSGTNTGDQDLSSFATTSATNTALGLKVDKVTGKELSTNDYSTLEKNKLAAITGTNTGDQDLSSFAIDSNVVHKTGTETITGAKTFSLDVNINGNTVGRGGGSVATNTANGARALLSNITGSYNNANGRDALYSNTTGSANTANGAQALYSNTTGSYNIANGFNSLKNNTTGSANTANGVNALYSNTTGSYNIANGFNALYSNTIGSYNIANGFKSLKNNTTGGANTANGAEALLSNTTGNSNTADGFNALYSNTTGDSNTANGAQALLSNITGSNNTANGMNAGRYIADGSTANTTPNNSVFLGDNTKALTAYNTNQIVIGSGAIGAGSNTVVLGNNDIVTTALKGNTLIGTTSVPLDAKLSIVGNGLDAALRIYKNATDVVSGLPIFSVRETGRIGIGQTVSPDFKVEIRDFEATDYVVNSNTYFTPVLDTSVALSLQNAENNSGGACYLQLGPRNTQNLTAYAYIGAVSVSNVYSPRLVFGMRTGSLAYEEKMRINVDGIGMFTLGNPVASAALQIDGTTKGFLPPRMTTTQINAIGSPAIGLMVYNTTINHVCFYDGNWRKVSHSVM